MESVGIDSAREAFFGEGRLPVAAVRPPVLQSWIRCVDLGLAQRTLPRLAPIADGDLHVLQQRHEALRRLCRPELEVLAGEARETGSVVILADGDGMILDAIGDLAFASRAAQVALRPGVSWKEASTGTNAIGTAIAERKPVAVHGPEHFFAGHGVLSCACTPIMDPRGAIIGALDISGPSAVGHGHALGMIRMAVDQIEHRLFRQRFDDCRVLRFHGDPAMLGTSREGILVFREDRLVAGNRRGLALVDRHWDALDESLIGQLFEERARHGADLALRLSTGAQAVGRWDTPARGSGGAAPQFEARSAPSGGALAEREAELIASALAEARGNVSKAARSLGIHRSTIHRYLSRQRGA
ncbi:helix-turn-helix domain-containing protein [Sphingomonas sp. H39-1-10]|uniref:sigma-54-dependent Fis family transcriptional regulator n=1 Tax=Sphingomonas pollutisoli TaxID=3030829 RepID=UPI0023BA0C9B|nr:GAF domain-containing protein [Sphingomonas pollutisoli]MDF0487902.1 helix-turn-helix domain-containing protein [Sphingomonas pollutisoli]